MSDMPETRDSLRDVLQSAAKQPALCEYEVTITEKLVMSVTIQARSSKEAEELVAEMWEQGEYHDCKQFCDGADFKARQVEPVKRMGDVPR